MNVQDIMTPFEQLACLQPGDAVTEAARLMKQRDTGVIPVIDSRDARHLVGLITDRDIAVRIVAGGEDVTTAKVGDFMTKNPEGIDPSTNIKTASRRMSELQVHRLPVLDQNQLVGIVALGDLAVAAEKEAGKALGGISEGAKAEGRVQ